MAKLRIALLICAAFALSACNTVHGFGKDIKKAGEELEEAAEKAKK
ncbi:MAG TPA: entericidin A/B family lipoprotein [Arenimonas sp.]|nr:entericidin A/B family lipoprotein [Arenimonas sp.]